MRCSHLLIGALLVASAACSRSPENEVLTPGPQRLELDHRALESFVLTEMEEQRIPGVAVAIFDGEGVLFTAGYGWADIEQSWPMTPQTVMNIASISKTVTATAVLQLAERRLIDLDTDVNEYLPFSVRHPEFPDTPITARQLLTHTAGIEDWDAYDASYACGDPAVSLADWIRGYFEPGGQYFAPENFLSTGPGEGYSYSNLGFGLLGYLVEVVSGEPFADFIRANIFEPLSMDETGWYLADIEPARHATPYAWIEPGDTLDNPLFAERNGEFIEDGGFVAFCPYSFFNIPDGLVRTSVEQLTRFGAAWLGGGEFSGARVLDSATVAETLSPQVEAALVGTDRFAQGLAWRQRLDLEFGVVWSHSGGDPGVRTILLFSPEEGRGVAVFANRAARVGPIVERLWLEATRSGS
jgi:CubicO group peptidase (beta-lactamase class C family)